MRKYLIGVAVVVAALITAAVAMGLTQRTLNESYSKDGTSPTTKPGKPTALFLEENSTDPDNTANNQQPKYDTTVTDKLPKGGAINQDVPGTCSASDGDFAAKGPSACSKKSSIGSGTAKVRLKFNGSGDIAAAVAAFNDKKNKTIILYINPSGSNPIVLRSKVTGKPGKTQKLVVPIPVTCALGQPPNCGASGEARIVQLQLLVKKITKKVTKHGKKVTKGFIVTPKTCPTSGKWNFSLTFKGGDGIDQVAKSSQACKK